MSEPSLETLPPQTTETPPLPNSQEARTPDGTLKDVSSTSTTQPTDQQTKPETKPETKADAKPVVPEKYDDFKAPEGYTLSKELIENATPLFKELGLDQAGAQKLVDFHAKSMLDASKAPQEAYTSMRKDWQAKTLADSSLAAAGKLRPEVESTISKAIDGLGDPTLSDEFREVMDLTGAGDHPAFVKAMYKWAQTVTEGKHVTGGGPSPHGQAAPGTRPPSIANAMYPNLK